MNKTLNKVKKATQKINKAKVKVMVKIMPLMLIDC